MAIDYFLKMDGVEGESQVAGHEKEIELMSWSWGASNPGSMHYGSGGGTGKVAASDFNFTMRVGKGSPKLLNFITTGKHIDNSVLTCRKAGGDAKPYDYLVIKFINSIISSFQTGGSAGDDVPMDSISLNFAKIEYDYKVQDSAKGTVSSAGKASYDLSKAEAS